MCGRFSQALPTDLLVTHFSASDKRFKEPEPSWNVAPLQSATVVVLDSITQKPVLTRMEWGLITPWEKSPDWTNFRPNISRCETVAESKPFRRAFREQRCIVPVNAYYEWKKTASGKGPFAVGRADGRPLAVGAIWESWWRHGADRRLTFSIVTTPATANLVGINDRMPLVLELEDWSVWLGQEPGDIPSLLRPAHLGHVRPWRIGKAVASPNNNGPEILQAA